MISTRSTVSSSSLEFWRRRLGAPYRSQDEEQPWNNCGRPDQKAHAAPPRWNGNPDAIFSDFRQHDDIIKYLHWLSSNRPDLVGLRDIGKSWEGRPLWLLEITNRSPGSASPEDKPCIFLEAGIHAREWIAPSTALFVADSLVRNAGEPSVAALLGRFLFSILVLTNPDGYVYTWEVDRLWRKTRSDRRGYMCQKFGSQQSVAGVDGNRNWDFYWGATNSSRYLEDLHRPCSQVFIGPAPFSEPEVRAVSQYLSQRQLRSLSLAQEASSRSSSVLEPGPGFVAAFLDYHSYAKVLLPPWATTAETPARPDGDYQTGLTGAMVAAFRNFSGRTFDAGADFFPADPGTGPDWAYGKLGVRASMTVELEGDYAGETYGFCEPAVAIREIGLEQWAGVRALAEYLVRNGANPSTSVGMFAQGLLPTWQFSFHSELHHSALDSLQRPKGDVFWAEQSLWPLGLISLTVAVLLSFLYWSRSCRHKRDSDSESDACGALNSRQWWRRRGIGHAQETEFAAFDEVGDA